MVSGKNNLYEFLKGYERIVIPDVQRDYVMGSGGKNLESLLKVMNDNAKTKKGFNFSCIMGCEKDKSFYVYDGQQRFTTLVYLSAYILSGIVEVGYGYKENLKKYSFTGRKKANEYLLNLLNGNNELDICDFTTYSIAKLLNCFEKGRTNEYRDISLDFLMNRVVFSIVPVDEAKTAEQFFFDLNDGVHLEGYEIYKAEMNHKIMCFLKDSKDGSEKEIFKQCLLKIDNEWLKLFLPFKTDKHCEEEIEIDFIKYCFRMLYIERYGSGSDCSDEDTDWIKPVDVIQLHSLFRSLLNKLKDIDISKIGSSKWLNYSFCDSFFLENIEQLNGAYWNLADTNYLGMLNRLLSNICSNEINKDVLIWCYITNIDLEDNLWKYLRFIKKILNANRIVNEEVFFEYNSYCGRVWYSRYGVFGVPNYYKTNGNNCTFKGTETADNKDFIFDVIAINKLFRGNKTVSTKKLLDNLETNLLNTKSSTINDILKSERLKYNSDEYEEIKKFENLPCFNGIVNNILDNGNLIINYEVFISKIAANSDGYWKIKGTLEGIFEDLSNVVNVFDDFIMDNLTINWIYSTGNLTTNGGFGGVTFHCLSDFFTHDAANWKTILQRYLKGEYETITEPNKSQYYLKNFSTIKTGWLAKVYGTNCIYRICYPEEGAGYYFKQQIHVSELQ